MHLNVRLFWAQLDELLCGVDQRDKMKFLDCRKENNVLR